MVEMHNKDMNLQVENKCCSLRFWNQNLLIPSTNTPLINTFIKDLTDFVHLFRLYVLNLSKKDFENEEF